MTLLDKQLPGETPRAGTMAHGITAGGIAKPILVNSDGTVNVTGGGGGTEYTEGDTDASITGNAMMMEGAGNTLVPVQGNATDGILVNLGANNDVVASDGGGSLTIDYNGSAISTSNPLPIQPPASGYLSTLAYGSDDGGTTKRVIKTDSGGAVQVDVESGTITTVSTVTNLSQLGGANVPIGAGLEATAVRVTLPTDGTGKVSVVQGTATNLKAQAEMYQGGTAVSSTNPLSIESTAIQDTGNSTSTPLGSSGNFTGSAFDMNDYASWSVNIYSDKASSSNGMIVQWSDDATHWDFQDAQTYNAAVGNMITFGRKARYVRLNYTNTNSAQSTFRVTSYAQPVSIRQTRKFIGNALTDQDTAQVVVAALQGHTTAGGGGWVDVKVNPSGSVAVQDSQVIADNAGFTDGTSKVFPIGYIYDEVAGTALTENDIGASRMNVNRAQVHAIEDGATRGRYATVTASNAVKVDGSAVTQPVSYATTGSGTATGAVRVELPTNGTGLVTTNPATAANWGIYAEDAAETAGGNLMMAGGVRRDTAVSSSGTSGDNSTINLSAEGAVWGTLTPTTTSGCSVAMFTSADGSTALTNSAQVIKASAGNLYGYYIYNPNSAATYVHFYNTAAASVTVGTTNPLVTFCIPATAGANLTFPYPVTFSNAGWSISATTTGGGNTAPTTALEAVVFYK